ncbi:tRNA 2-selenouridine(34) synthase MnmH [Aquirufa sp.]|jgi:tRNA 2-selenouridine synthase|uniref:tRNA 2-selenouridine(34) synthase MnmH n=1 Tax=Aquirufa sp. TaxID=2676249 RepID=UPI0037BF19DC
MPEKLNTEAFLDAAMHFPILDVRSPGEFERAHIPGAISFPIFDNEERAQVGTTYKQIGKDEAIELGLAIVGPKLAHWVKAVKKIAIDNTVLVHCWRGGMRSGSMTWLFETTGLKVKILVGGYKAYRNYVVSRFDEKIPFVVLGGKTGSGKTDILLEMQKRGTQVIDLEGVAHHRGSAFGHLGLAPQPSSEQFENEVVAQLRQMNYQKPIWIEDESRHIGQVFMPLGLYSQLRAAPLLFLDIDAQYRLPYLVEVYAHYPKEALAQAIGKIKKRLGGDFYKKALEALDEDDFYQVAAITLNYYDKAYMHGLHKRSKEQIHVLVINTLDTHLQTDAVSAHPICQQSI